MRTLKEWTPVLIKDAQYIEVVTADETNFYLRVIPKDYESEPVYFLIDKDWQEVINYDIEQAETYLKKLYRAREAV